MMDRIDCLRAFVRTLDGGSFSAAAKELGIGQPAISKRIAMLESEFGAQLFSRINGDYFAILGLPLLGLLSLLRELGVLTK